jgi:hypothetical protein
MFWHDLDYKGLSAADVTFDFATVPVEIGTHLLDGMECGQFSVNNVVMGIQDSEVGFHGQLFEGDLTHTDAGLHLYS